jgi:KDO2-lipid IV(A) lauroyltransferase
MLAKKHDFTVVHMKVTKIKRSHYAISFEILTENPKDLKDYEITDIFLEKTSEQIIENPALYFWTHNRFKHRDKVPSESTKKVRVRN